MDAPGVHAPVRPSIPLGISTAITGRRTEEKSCCGTLISRVVNASGSPRSPVPSSASTYASKRAFAWPPGVTGRSCSGSARISRTQIPAACAQCSCASASAVWGSPESQISASPPRWQNSRAAATPSPPLLPVPHRNNTRFPRHSPARRRCSTSTTAMAACSIRTAAGTPRAKARSSVRRISAGVSRGSVSKSFSRIKSPFPRWRPPRRRRRRA